MLTHIVLLQPKPETTQEEILAALERIRDLQQHIPEIIDVQIGASLSSQEKRKGYTYGFIMHFLGEEQLNVYALHPIHRAAGAELSRICTDIIDFDMV